MCMDTSSCSSLVAYGIGTSTTLLPLVSGWSRQCGHQCDRRCRRKSFVVAGTAMDPHSLQIGTTYFVGAGKHPVVHEIRRAVADHGVPLHLPEPEAPVAAAAVGGLADQHGVAAGSPAAVYFVFDHVLELLVVGGPDEDEALHLLPGHAVAHALFPRGAHAVS